MAIPVAIAAVVGLIARKGSQEAIKKFGKEAVKQAQKYTARKKTKLKKSNAETMKKIEQQKMARLYSPLIGLVLPSQARLRLGQAASHRQGQSLRSSQFPPHVHRLNFLVLGPDTRHRLRSLPLSHHK